MTKRDDALAALKDIRKALQQGRDHAMGVIGKIIANVEAGEDLKPLPPPAPRVRTPMKPMIAPQPAPEPEAAPEPEVAETTDEPSDEPDEKEGDPA